MKFLVDRCAGRRLADWLRAEGYDVVETRERGTDPGDPVILRWAADDGRVLITIDTDFGRIVFAEGARHCDPACRPRRHGASSHPHLVPGRLRCGPARGTPPIESLN